jgi:rhomboid protease GluP
MGMPMLCPRCRRIIRSDDENCPHCRLARPGESWMRVLPGLWLLNSASIVKDIFYLNLAIYVLALALAPVGPVSWHDPFTVLSPSPEALLLLGATGAVPLTGVEKWWTLLSASYLHGGLLHFGFEMAALCQVGPSALRRYGPARTIVLYTAGGAAGLLVASFAGVPLTVGASAALSGLLGASLHRARNQEGTGKRPPDRVLWGWGLGLVLFGYLCPDISNWSHLGGAASGYALAWLVGSQETLQESRLHRGIATACGVVTFAVLAWGLGNSLFLRLLA